MARKIRYLTLTDMKKKKRVVEHVEVKLSSIRYRNTKNRIVKFDARKKLRVEVVFKIKRGVKFRSENSTSYGLPLRRRKKPISEKIIHNQILKKQMIKLGRGHNIVNTSEPLHNLYSWSYFYVAKTRAEKAEARKKERGKEKKKNQKSQRERVQQLKEKFKRV